MLSTKLNDKLLPVLVLLSSVGIGAIVTILNNIILGNNLIASSIIGALYFSLVFFCITLLFFNIFLKFATNPVNIFAIFLMIYYFIGLLPISLYRGYIDNKLWIILLSISVVAVYIGKFTADKIHYENNKKNIIRTVNIPRVKFLYKFSILAVLLIFVKYGFLFTNPDRRFMVPTILQYLVELVIPTTILYLSEQFNGYNLEKKYVKSFLIVILSFFLLLSLGYRNQPMMLILSILFLLLFTKFKSKTGFSINFRIVATIILTATIFIFSLMFLIRQETSERLLDVENLSAKYNIVNFQYISYLLPIHMSSREAMGVSEIAKERIDQIENYVNPHLLFIQDLFTVLPGEQETSGSILGKVVNLDENVSLTAGLIGGIYISYGFFGVFLFLFLIGFLINYIWKKYRSSNSSWDLSFVVILLTYSIELVNRGLFKPMYIFVIAYLFLCRGVAFKVNEDSCEKI